MKLRNNLVSFLCCFLFQCNTSVKHENRFYKFQVHTIENAEIMKREYLYHQKPLKQTQDSNLLLTFIEKLPQLQKENLKKSLLEIKRIRKTGL